MQRLIISYEKVKENGAQFFWRGSITWGKLGTSFNQDVSKLFCKHPTLLVSQNQTSISPF